MFQVGDIVRVPAKWSIPEPFVGRILKVHTPGYGNYCSYNVVPLPEEHIAQAYRPSTIWIALDDEELQQVDPFADWVRQVRAENSNSAI